MTTILVTKDDKGKLVGAGEKNRKAYARFKKMLDELEPGEIFTINHWFPRHGKFHRLHFAMLASVYDSQEQFDDPDELRMWVQVGAGHVRFVPGPTGRMVALPESIAWRKMDDEEFRLHHEKVKKFLRTTQATRFLWPTVDDQSGADGMARILDEFEREQS